MFLEQRHEKQSKDSWNNANSNQPLHSYAKLQKVPLTARQKPMVSTEASEKQYRELLATCSPNFKAGS